MEDTVPSMRIVTTSAVFLALAAGSASAQNATPTAPAQPATTTAPGKPLQLFQIIEQKDGTSVRPHHRTRYAKRKPAGTQIAHQKAGPTRDAFVEVRPAREPEQAATPPSATPRAATPPAATTPAVVVPTLTSSPAATTAAAPANIWPAPDLTPPGMEGLTPTPTAPASVVGEPAAPVAPANQSEVLATAYPTVQAAQVTPPSTPQVAPPAAVQVAQADAVSPTDAAADQPHDATNATKTSSRAASWPIQQAMFASAEPQNPNPVGSVSWIVHVLAALGATIAAGALAWFLIDPLPARSYE
jgi:hypothetical protein